ncbi:MULTISPECIES: hypothetical protein [Vibrio]|uniref:Uncharacterized protein n=1 Tax=Vibrio alginolyticus TaxID=663 RepID=A0A6M4NN21_VIBAL|nr:MULTISPECIES: hypothetical protein [Vibrio]MCV3264914.1 hypothetical protein [Vibrio harveyi]MBO0138602.1 hypothetical protein [Vibrio sp. Vb2736]MBO0185228.1 hypothetical protein [Vibrio parahaemolyticus]MDG2778418.1 hypothetical protein [Vibrio parahaemolyticus]MDG2782997.1 hypothetical protein [Vibrio parahaemolyticus]
MLLDIDEIRSVEQFQVVNALSSTVSRVTLKEATTNFNGDNDEMFLAHTEFYVFETVSEIDRLCKGEAAGTKYSELKRNQWQENLYRTL